ncbi:hypothetical protein ACT3TH_05970 [Psychrobacter sp. AOP22-C1-C5]|uniref:hypothetical protein n=1 Tax=Psychrobacter sp. AOP22-C1-C5 TaxID=3457716 RepID=UPI004036F37F
MRKSVLNTALSTAFIVALGFGISACSGDKEGEHESHEVMAIDRVDEAAELARANAPEAEKMDFPETAPMPAAEGDAAAVDGAATTDAAATTGVATTEATAAGTDTAEAAATDSTDAGLAGASGDSTDTAATNGAAPQ